MENLEFYFVRHADKIGGEAEGRDESDRNLSPLGEKQLSCVAGRFAGKSFDAVLSSPLVRCVRTAAAIANRLAEPPVIELLPELVERSTPTGYLGQSVEYLSRYYDKLILCPDKIYGGPEQIFIQNDKQDILNRCNALIEYLLRRFTLGQRVLLVGHGVFAISFLQAWVGITEKEHADYRYITSNTSVTKIKLTPEGVRYISFQNDTAHLRDLDPDTDFNR